MESKGYSHLVDLWQKYTQKGLTQEEAKKTVVDTLKLPWVQRINVFADNVLCLLDLHTLDYLYISPSIENLTGYSPENFTSSKFATTLMSEAELHMVITSNHFILAKLSELKLQSAEMMKVRLAFNYFLKRKDGALVNVLQQNIPLLLNSDGVPLLQMIMATDITAFNNKHEHFYNVVLTKDDETEQLLFSGKMENEEELISPREQEVLKLVSRGQSSKAIADALNISAETVKTHRKNLLQKANAKDTIDLVRYGYANGWL